MLMDWFHHFHWEIGFLYMDVVIEMVDLEFRFPFFDILGLWSCEILL